MLKKLRTKFICINMALLTVMLVLVFSMVFGFTRDSLRRESLQMMESLGASPMHLFRPDDRREEVKLPYFILQIDLSGTIIAQSGGYYDLSDKEFLMEVLSDACQTEAQSGELPEYHLRYLWVNDMMGRRLVCADTTSEESTLDHLLLTCLILGAASFLGFLGLSFYLSDWALKPVKESWEQQKQFIADASHELKTPLTVILTNAELLQSPEYGDQDKGQFADSIVQMSRQMRLLVERLLTLSRMDNNAANMTMEEFDLSELVSDGLLPFEPLLFEREMLLESDISENIRITGSREHLQQVLDILLDNAMKYGNQPGMIRVKLKKVGGRCVLSVSNQGEPIARADLPNLFKRFYRVDKARSRDGSTGLGLAIAQSIVTAHQGNIRAESENGWNTFTVEL